MKSVAPTSVILIALLFAGSFCEAQEQPPIRDFVTKHYFHGLPYEEARSYGAEVLPELYELLQNPELEPYWANIVMAIGFIGEPSAVPKLLTFLHSQEGEVSADRFRALITVPTAMGYLAQADGDVALEALRGWCGLNGKASTFSWFHGRYDNGPAQDLFARLSIQGLGISGRPEAYESLQTMLRDTRLPEDWRDNLDEAISLNLKVDSLGPEMVFSKEAGQ